MAAADREPIHPFHVEAYPRLNLRLALRAMQRGSDHVVWHDQAGALVGIARLACGAGAELTIDARFRALPYLPHDVFHDRIAYEVVDRIEGRADVLSVCRGCGDRKRGLVFCNTIWLCQSCQRLGYRSTILSVSVKEACRLRELDALIGSGRPRYMRKAVYEEMKEERYWLRRLVEDEPATPPLHQRYVLTPTWLSEPPLLHGAAYAGGGGEGDDLLDLVGSPLFAGVSFKLLLERDLGRRVRAAYRELAASSKRVSGLRLRRAVGEVEFPELPILEAGYSEAKVVKDAPGEALEVRMVVPFAGDPAFFDMVLPVPPERLPIALVDDGDLILTARFSRGNAAFVAALLHAQIKLVRECLWQQERAVAEARATHPDLVKRIVAEQLPRLDTKG